MKIIFQLIGANSKKMVVNDIISPIISVILLEKHLQGISSNCQTRWNSNCRCSTCTIFCNTSIINKNRLPIQSKRFAENIYLCKYRYLLPLHCSMQHPLFSLILIHSLIRHIKIILQAFLFV